MKKTLHFYFRRTRDSHICARRCCWAMLWAGYKMAKAMGGQKEFSPDSFLRDWTVANEPRNRPLDAFQAPLNGAVAVKPAPAPLNPLFSTRSKAPGLRSVRNRSPHAWVDATSGSSG